MRTVAGAEAATKGAVAGDERSSRAGRRRFWAWAAFLALSPACIGVITWAALSWNGAYPKVAAPVPPGWQEVPGVYASFSVPKSWSLEEAMSDSNGDVYYSGLGGDAGQSVTEASSPPSPLHLPAVVQSYLGGNLSIASMARVRVKDAALAWRYTFATGPRAPARAVGILAWDKVTQSEVWLVAAPASRLGERVLSTLRLAA
jgi:hypothetical protein